MPEICRFYGIVIQMYFNDHAPAHFHARYGSDQVVVAIDPLAVLRGRLPSRAQGMVIEWADLRRQELMQAWTRAQKPGVARQNRPTGMNTRGFLTVSFTNHDNHFAGAE